MKTKLFTTVLALLIFSFICKNENIRAQVPAQDSLALVALYNSTDGANWTNNTNWLTGPVSTWYGVSIYNNRVFNVSLYNNSLNGTIPAEIGDLDGLYNLNLGGNGLSGNIPTEIGNMILLREIYLHDNYLEGTIPVSVANMTYLERFALSGNQLTGTIPAGLGNLVNLRRLQIDYNQLSGTIPPELGNLINLEWLWLASNQLTGSIPAELGNLGNLQEMFLNSNQLSGSVPAELGNLSNLKQMLLNQNQFSGSIPAEFTNLDSLEDLFIYGNQFTELPGLSSLTSLTRLRIQNNKFTFEDIEPNIVISSFIYSPQDSVGEGLDTTIANGENLTLMVEVGGTANLYQWTKDGSDIPGATNNTFEIVSADSSDSGSYVCKISNTIATELILYSREMNVSVGSASGIEETNNVIPKVYTLSQNYPNPFNPTTVIKYQVPELSFVTLRVYDVLGNEVARLVDEEKTAGSYEVLFDGTRFTSSVYFYVMRADNFIAIKKLILIK